MTRLFSPATIAAPQGPGLQLRNRTVLAPMCQYSVEARDGKPTDWHLTHLGARAAGGFGLVIAEASAVTAQGRISPGDTGLWNDDQIAPWARIVDFIKSQGAAAGIQLAHAGAKASTYEWLPGFAAASIPAAEGGWQSVAPSVLDIYGLALPHELSVAEIGEIVQAWGAAARRADQAGFDFVQIHAAHGYLLHEFLSPLSNKRTDEYGDGFEGRTRLLREVVAAVRSAWPATKPLGIRLSGEDWVDDGWRIDDTVRLAPDLHRMGVTAFDLSSAGIGPFRGPTGPGYQVPLAAAVKQALDGTDAFVTAVGLITDATQAEQVLITGQADGVGIARAALAQPNWPVVAARELRVEKTEAPYAKQYWRAHW